MKNTLGTKTVAESIHGTCDPALIFFFWAIVLPFLAMDAPLI